MVVAFLNYIVYVYHYVQIEPIHKKYQSKLCTVEFVVDQSSVTPCSAFQSFNQDWTNAISSS